MTESPTRSDRVVRLDTLTVMRAGAAMLVFLFHARAGFEGTSLEDLANRIGARGNIGVVFFFVLSGFVLSWGWSAGSGRIRFLAMRLGRIWPAHATTWAIAVALAAAGIGDPVSLGQGVASLGLVHAWSHDPTYNIAANGVSWTLSVELFFYVVFALGATRLLRIGSRGRHIGITILLTVSLIESHLAYEYAGYYGWGWATYFFPPGRLAEFLLGVLLAAELREFGPRRVPPLWAAATATVVLYLLASSGSLGWPTPTVMLVAFATLIFTAATRDAAGTGPSWSRRALYLGEVSFAFYLVHQPLVERAQSALDGGGATAATASLGALVGLSAAMVAAHALHVGIEVPAYRRVKRRLGRLPNRRPTRPGNLV